MRRPPSCGASGGRRAVALAVVALLGISARAPAAAADDPTVEAEHTVQRTIDEVMAVLHDKSLDSGTKKDRVEQIAYAHFDFYVISRLVLARNWKKFSEQQRADFVQAFKEHLSATYRDTLDNFSDETITIEDARLEPGGDVTVKTLVHRTSDNVKVDYRLRKSDGEWRGIDVIVEGVSIVQNFRSQAQEIVSNEGPDALIQKLREKNLKDVPPPPPKSS
jgi:phospholipid transport system substrate-binding protein